MPWHLLHLVERFTNWQVYQKYFKRLTEHSELPGKFKPKRAPWFGGFYECMIGLTKSSWEYVWDLGYSERPTTDFFPTDIEDLEPLTPSHLLYGRRILCLPYPLPCENGQSIEPLTSRSLNKRFHIQTFPQSMEKWIPHIITRAPQDIRSGQNIQSIKYSDIVFVHDDDRPRIARK